MTAVILTYLVLSIEPMVRCMLRRISDAGIFYCSENSLQCYNESAEPTAELIVRIRSMQPGAREWLTRATHRAQHPVLRAGAGVYSIVLHAMRVNDPLAKLRSAPVRRSIMFTLIGLPECAGQ